MEGKYIVRIELWGNAAANGDRIVIEQKTAVGELKNYEQISKAFDEAFKDTQIAVKSAVGGPIR